MRASALPRTAGLIAAIAANFCIPAQTVASGARASADGTIAGPVLAPSLPRGTPDEVAQADPAAPIETLSQALERAYWTNPGLLAERARLRSIDYRLPQARSQYGLHAEYQASYGYQRDNVEILPGGYNALSGWSSTAAAILTQPVYSFGRNAAAENIATAQIGFQRERLRETEQQTLFTAISAYAGVIRDRNGVIIAQDNLDLLTRELSDNEARLTVRETTATDVEQVRTRFELARAQLLSAQRASASSDASFLAVTGAPAGRLAAPNPLAIPVQSLEEAYEVAARNNPVLGAAYSREKISRGQRALARAESLPRVDLRGRAEVGSVTPYSDQLRQTHLRGEVIVSGPIFTSGMHMARIGEAEAANDSDWRLIDQALRDNRFEVADAWNQWLALSASVDSLERSVKAAQAAYDGALLQERAGFRTTLDVIDLARELLSARTSYNGVTASAYVARARLLAAIGMLDQAYLLPDAPRYDPETHYRRVKDNGDMPLLTPILSAIDGVTLGGGRDRSLRDPSASVTAPGVEIARPEGDISGKTGGHANQETRPDSSPP